MAVEAEWYPLVVAKNQVDGEIMLSLIQQGRI